MDNLGIYIHAQNQVQSLTYHLKIVHDFIFLYGNHITLIFLLTATYLKLNAKKEEHSYEDGRAMI